MKKTIVLSILGIAASGIAAFGQQGQILFNNYLSDSYEPVYYNPNAANAPAGLAGRNVDDANVEVQLYYMLGNQTSDTVSQFLATATAGNTTFMDLSYNPGGTWHGSPAPAGSTGGPGGYYNGGVQILTGWTEGATVTFMTEGWETQGAYGGSSYATSLLRGQSALWTESSVIVGYYPITPPTPEPMVNGPTALELSLVPEPTTLAFVGLGLLSLLALGRRKNV